jgi:NAD(P)-dependent dehydrogenase (short-subunit alcohol dehydrogenase family)
MLSGDPATAQKLELNASDVLADGCSCRVELFLDRGNNRYYLEKKMCEQYLEGKTAMVTGGASGMGRAMALAFARHGADIIIGSLVSKHREKAVDGEVVFMPTEKQLMKTKDEIEELGGSVITSDLDVGCSDSCRHFFDLAMSAFGKVDILANAAGITAENRICGHPEALWTKVMNVNANGTFRMIKLALPGMIKRRWGRIVNIASTAASVGAETSGAYCASKAAVVGLTRCVALEGAEHGVTCNAISPGWVQTDFQKTWMDSIARADGGGSGKDYQDASVAENPQKRLVQPSEIGALAAYLCSEAALGITGQDLTVSAGSLW